MIDQSTICIHCDICGKPAVEISLSYDGGNSRKVVIQSFIGTTTMPVSEENASFLAKALREEDYLAIYRFDFEWIPSYCPDCKANYCGEHWIVIPQFDDDLPGWYDCSYGTCPKGHQRMVDD